MTLLALDRVHLWRGGRVLLEDFSLTMSAGDAVLLTGPNGIGKSSLIRLAAGLLRPVAGSVHHASAALADERLALDPELPLRRALAFWSDLDGRGDALADAMDRLDLLPLADVPVRLLSTGQRRRAALARVVASDAPLWLLDEPANGLDAASVTRLVEVIADHRAAGGAVLAASHQSLGGAWREVALER